MNRNLISNLNSAGSPLFARSWTHSESLHVDFHLEVQGAVLEEMGLLLRVADINVDLLLDL